MEDAAKINTGHREAACFLQVLLTLSLSDPKDMLNFNSSTKRHPVRQWIQFTAYNLI